ncbi:sugar diacid recognition domain-containing protein [Paenibacillus sp. Marseille-Q4541]|uniref:CdaR family transcriptional regulator n=1 Tax=Paenibacillus sp. Marseille-Q4541 TaxID=2831522 RepID=UPI001BA8B79B|nr:sugar diacid recognition domain-containing protein [Paenibacillus sp. Marseille-Q4541]
MLYQLSETLAQDIVDKMMKDIPYNINIMNAQGIIIGSGNRKRVGTEHQGAVRALSSGEMIEVWEDGEYEKKGTNEPIVIGNSRVGVIGITGNPEEVRPFCNIVRTTVVLLIEQGIALHTIQNEEKQKKALLEILLHQRGLYTQKLRKEALFYKINLTLPTTVLYIKGLRVNQDRSHLLMLHPSFLIDESTNTYIFLIQSTSAVDEMITQLLKDERCKISMGKHEPFIADSYHQAQSAMHVAEALQLQNRMIPYPQVEFLVKLSHANLTHSEQLIMKLEDKESVDLLDTLRTFINNNGSVSLTSTHLNIHRNTLQYRLKRIHDLTGKDPRNVFELFELTHGLLALFK